MEPEETTEDLELEQEDETAEDEQSPEGDASQEAKTLTESQELAKAKSEAAKWRRLWEKERKVTATPKATQTAPNQPSSVDIEETVLKAQGMDDELLSKLKKIAALNETSLLDAQKDELFVAAKTQYEKDKASKGAAMPPSRGSGSPKPKVTLTTPGLTREQHKALLRG